MQNIRYRLMRLARRARKNVVTNMQRVRLKLLADLETMFDMAKTYATDEGATPKQRQIWVRIMGYIGQVMNSLSKSFDEATITKDLKELERMVREAMAEKETGGTETTAKKPLGG